MFHSDRPLSFRIHRAVVTYVTLIFYCILFTLNIFFPSLFVHTRDSRSVQVLKASVGPWKPVSPFTFEDGENKCCWDGMLRNTIRRYLLNVLSVKLSNFLGTLHAPRTFVKTLITICLRLFSAKMLFCVSVQSNSPKKVQWIIHSDYKWKKNLCGFLLDQMLSIVQIPCS